MILSKSIQLTTLLLIFTFSLSSCNNSPSESKVENENSEIQENVEGTAENKLPSLDQKAAKLSDETVKEVVKIYLDIKNALVESNAEKASTEAARMQTLNRDMDIEIMEEILEDANEIAHSKDVEEQRNAFEELSDNVYSMLKANGSDGKEMYRQFCPMAMNNEGAYWLSSEKEIRNPYFGERMLKCGSVKETLN